MNGNPTIPALPARPTVPPRTFLFMALLLALLSVLIGYLLSKASLVGKAGMNLFYKEYRFLKIWWQGGLVVFVVLMILLLLQGLLFRRLTGAKNNIAQLVLLLVAGTGLYFTYVDFTQTLTHRLLGEKFHIGGYLFWIGWMAISLFYLWQGNRTRAQSSAV